MEILELHQIMDFMRLDGHGYVQSIFLIMIWWTTRGVRKDLSEFKSNTKTRLENQGKNINNHEVRIFQLEKLKIRGQ